MVSGSRQGVLLMVDRPRCTSRAVRSRTAVTSTNDCSGFFFALLLVTLLPVACGEADADRARPPVTSPPDSVAAVSTGTEAPAPDVSPPPIAAGADETKIPLPSNVLAYVLYRLQARAFNIPEDVLVGRAFRDSADVEFWRLVDDLDWDTLKIDRQGDRWALVDAFFRSTEVDEGSESEPDVGLRFAESEGHWRLENARLLPKRAQTDTPEDE